MRRACLWLALAGLCYANGFGPDQRRPLPPGKPFSAVGRITVNGSFATGCLIGPDLVLTVAHAVVNSETDAIFPDWKIEFGWTAGQPHAEAHALNATYTPARDSTPSAGNDWAVVRLDQPLGNQYGWIEPQNYSNEQLKRMPIEFLGFGSAPDEAHPEFRECAAPFRASGFIEAVSPNIFHHDAAMWGGSSGGPLVTWDHNVPRIVGVVGGDVHEDGETVSHGFKALPSPLPGDYWSTSGNWATPVRRFYADLQGLAPRNRLANLRPAPYLVGGAPIETNATQVLAMGGRLLVVNAAGELWAHDLKTRVGPSTQLTGPSVDAARFMLAVNQRLLSIDDQGGVQAREVGTSSVSAPYTIPGPPLFSKDSPPRVVLAFGNRLLLIDENGAVLAAELGTNLGSPRKLGGPAVAWGSPLRLTAAQGSRLVSVTEDGGVWVQLLGASLGDAVFVPGPPVSLSNPGIRFLVLQGNRLLAINQQGQLWAFSL